MLQYAPLFDVVVAGHIHLGIVLFFNKLRVPKGRRILMAHGIEVWQRPKGMDRLAYWSCSEIWSVSNYTRQRILGNHPRFAKPILLFYNTLDPFFTQTPGSQKLPEVLHPLQEGYLLTISRLSSTEQYKGYDLVIRTLPSLLSQKPGVKYVLGGSWDATEIVRIRNLIKELQLEKHVYLPGFVPEGVLKTMYENAGVFVMPSRKEGFGIVFCEAAWCGTHVIAGNADGSPEALLNGKWGRLINPGDEKELLEALLFALNQPALDADAREKRRREVEEKYGFAAFCNRQTDLLNLDWTLETKEIDQTA
jgi:glycosyltransferase involved in cell wall biosynthesis